MRWVISKSVCCVGGLQLLSEGRKTVKNGMIIELLFILLFARIKVYCWNVDVATAPPSVEVLLSHKFNQLPVN